MGDVLYTARTLSIFMSAVATRHRVHASVLSARLLGAALAPQPSRCASNTQSRLSTPREMSV